MDSSSNSLYRIEALKGEENYGLWKTKMIDILTSTDFMEHADGTTVEPNDPAAKAAWQKKDRMALLVIRLRCRPCPGNVQKARYRGTYSAVTVLPNRASYLRAESRGI
ncbi:hypothetical protein B0H13DRAFT_1930193 [Mycena leptocephala]|nr:hypothetical protein B0H13DRAFT_1930193 [Mycena leptocephala]